MKVTFIYPRFEKFLESIPDLDRELVDHFLGNFTTPPSLGIPILAALTPPEWEIELVDDNNGDMVDYSADTDLVAINCFTPQATRAMEIADGYRAAGKTVLMGGFWPSTMPREALEHCDAVNIGDGEPTWRKILEDARNGTLRRKYNGGTRYDLAELPIPRRDLFYAKEGYDWHEDIVQVARGCTYKCGMCAIPTHAGHRIRLRPVHKIVEELETLKFDDIYLADDTLFFPNKRIGEWSWDLFEAVRPLEKKFFVASTMARSHRVGRRRLFLLHPKRRPQIDQGSRGGYGPEAGARGPGGEAGRQGYPVLRLVRPRARLGRPRAR